MSGTPSAVRSVRYDYSGALNSRTGLDENDVVNALPELEEVAADLWNRDLVEFRSGAAADESRQPLDAAFLDMPDRLLAAYDSDRPNSELDKIIRTARRLRETVDRVVVLGIGGSYMGAKALMDACCHPFHNELTRAERSGWPRMYFEGNNVDNDSCYCLRQLLQRDSQDRFHDGRWAIVVISKSGGTIETAAALRIFLRELESQFGRDSLPDLVVPVTGATGRLADLASAIGCRDRFMVPDGVGGRFSILSAVGLLPAALLGLDVVALLRGAWFMNQHVRSAPRGQNVVLNYVAVNRLLERRCSIDVRVLSAWSKSLESAGLWYDQLLAESIGKQETGVMPLTVVNTRDLHSRAQQHQEGIRNKSINNLILESWRCDPLAIGTLPGNEDCLNELAETTWPQLMSAAIAGTNEAYRSDGRPVADLVLPAANEHSMGQFFQMMMIATVIEGRAAGINPYGQPGVELYKKNMQRLLKSGFRAGGKSEPHAVGQRG
jgi:glucose-6-phosphate isomerase